MLKLVSNYRDDNQYRHSFNRLAEIVFNFSLEEWYQKGFWCDRYVPYSFADGDKVVSNVSISKMDLLVDGQRRKAIQIGTVMTHPDYRGRGLASKLIELVLAKYEQDYGLAYLFAEKGNADFYPGFGFAAVVESLFSVKIDAGAGSRRVAARRLDPSGRAVLNDIYRLVSSRAPVSRLLGVENAHNLAMFHCLHDLGGCLHYVEEEGVLAAFGRRNGALHIYDLISAGPFDAARVIGAIAGKDTGEAYFYFTPDLLGIEAASTPLASEDIFFVKGNLFEADRKFKYPMISQA